MDKIRQTEYIVTGGSSGIGAAVVDKLIQQGSQVLCLSRRPAKQSSENVLSLSCDLCVPEKAMADLQCIKKMKSLRGVVLCHGYGDFGALEQFSDKRIKKLIDTNFSSYAMLARLVIPVMKTKGEGVLVGIGSEAGLKAGKQGAVYSATKFAIRGMFQALRGECSASGVRVSMVNPGMVDTPFFDKLHFKPGDDIENAINPEDVADAVMSILHAPQNMVIDEINLSPLKTVVRNR